MRVKPEKIGVIHIIGIGGIGMSGMAEILHSSGYKVQGSDAAESANVERLHALGILVHVGHKEENLGNANIVIRSTAVKDTNPEVVAAHKRHIPVVKRADVLAEMVRTKQCIAIAGTHGKTTTTTMMATMLDAVGMDPTVINGGIINAYNSNVRLGKGEWIVAEADESDGTFIRLPAVVATISNIDREHMDYYGSFEKMVAAFRAFIENLPFYGFCVACKDHPEVAKLVSSIQDRKILTYGIEADQLDVKATHIRPLPKGSVFDVELSGRVKGGKRVLKNITLPVHGIHNVQNALVPIVVALELGVKDALVVKGYENYKGVKRRFTETGKVGGITVIDDYGHHPKEIAATLKTARSVADMAKGKVIAVVQPHRFSRVKDLFEEFCTCYNDADVVVIADIYTAGESPIDGITQEALVNGIKKTGKQVVLLPGPEKLPDIIRTLAEKNDIVVCLGAGNITQWAYALPQQLQDMAKRTEVA